MRLFLIILCQTVLGLLLCGLATPASGQTNEIALANEYFNKGEYEKAAVVYEELADDSRQFFLVYGNYLNTLLALNNYKEAEKLVKKAMKRAPNAPNYAIDLGRVYQRSGDMEQATKHFEKLIQQTEQMMIPAVAVAFQQAAMPEYAEKAYLQGRKNAKDPTLYVTNLMGVYMQQRNVPRLIEETLVYAGMGPGNANYAQNMLQNTLKEEKEFDQLETALISKVQQFPDQTAYSEMLIWLYTQRKDFFNALMQAKALDKRLRSEGSRVMELGNIALKNNDYESAIDAFAYVVKEYRGGAHYPQARQRLINAREEQVKNTFPIDKEQIKLLIADYNLYLSDLGRSPQTIEVMKNIAVLQAFYLDEKENASKALEEIIATPRANQNLVAESKLHLGDIYLLKGEPWEATLLYSQVEKSHKETPLGHEAKLRNAKLNYYKGEFELAQDHLDILKMATSREIANDAMKLSILITDNMGLDSTTNAMQDYARADLLLFQNKYLQAVLLLDSMLTRYPGHGITDEVYFQKARIYQRLGNYEQALANLTKITENHGQDVLGDDALFLMAQLYEENLNQPAKAQELYTDLMTQHPGSMYVVEARKRVRKLRGDAVN